MSTPGDFSFWFSEGCVEIPSCSGSWLQGDTTGAQFSWKCSLCGRGEREAFKDKRSEAGKSKAAQQSDGVTFCQHWIPHWALPAPAPAAGRAEWLPQFQSCLCCISCPAQGRWDVGQKVLLGKAVTYWSNGVVSLSCPCPAVSLSWGGSGIPVPRWIRGVKSLLEAGKALAVGMMERGSLRSQEGGVFPWGWARTHLSVEFGMTLSVSDELHNQSINEWGFLSA